MALTRNPALNGNMPSWLLSEVPWEPWQKVQRDALPSLLAMNAAYRRETGRDLDLTDTYRALGGTWGQIATFKRNYKVQWLGGGYYGDVRWYGPLRYVRRKGYPAAAVPGTSNHGWGLAIDFGEDSRYWVQANGDRFGWNWPDWARKPRSYEPWHIEAGVGVLLIDAPKQDTDTNLPDPDVNTPDDLEAKDWFDMATRAELREELEALIPDIAAAVWAEKVKDGPSGETVARGTQLGWIRGNTVDIGGQVWSKRLIDAANGIDAPAATVLGWLRKGVVALKPKPETQP